MAQSGRWRAECSPSAPVMLSTSIQEPGQPRERAPQPHRHIQDRSICSWMGCAWWSARASDEEVPVPPPPNPAKCRDEVRVDGRIDRRSHHHHPGTVGAVLRRLGLGRLQALEAPAAGSGNEATIDSNPDADRLSDGVVCWALAKQHDLGPILIDRLSLRKDRRCDIVYGFVAAVVELDAKPDMGLRADSVSSSQVG